METLSINYQIEEIYLEPLDISRDIKITSFEISLGTTGTPDGSYIVSIDCNKFLEEPSHIENEEGKMIVNPIICKKYMEDWILENMSSKINIAIAHYIGGM